MSRLMQLSSLYIRGAIATQTMANLNPQEIKRIDDIVRQVENDPEISADRYKFIQQLGATIKSDYRSDPLTAMQEFRIAIWRATVYLLHHRDYSYICSLCGATEYTTCTDKPKAFDRQYKCCPKCDMSLTDDQKGRTRCTVIKRDQGYSVIREDGMILHRNLTKEQMDGILVSPINSILGLRKVEDPEQILNDETQRCKWYVTWIWNYFRQILNENIIKTHNKHQIDIQGPADKIAFQILINELKRIRHKFNYDEGIKLGLTEDLDINTEILATEPPFTAMLKALKSEFLGHNVEITNTRTTIRVRKAGEVSAISTTIESEDPVIVLSFDGPANKSNDCGEGSWGDIVEYQSTRPIYDGNIDIMIADEAMGTVRRDLCDDKARKTFDILSQTGDAWREFSIRWGGQPARKAHIAEYLQVSPKAIDAFKQQIAAQCLIHGLK